MTNGIWKIAVVDDDAGVREATRGLLRSLGYSVVTFASAEEFLSFPERQRVSCVITDIRMPGMGGMQLLRCLVNEPDAPPVVVMTSFPEDHMQDKVVAAGARGFLTKPCRERVLVDCLRSAMAV